MSLKCQQLHSGALGQRGGQVVCPWGSEVGRWLSPVRNGPGSWAVWCWVGFLQPFPTGHCAVSCWPSSLSAATIAPSCRFLLLDCPGLGTRLARHASKGTRALSQGLRDPMS